jgi:catechol-2,3-dioxygenase
MFTEGGLCELVLVVKDVRASAKFYREVLHLIPETEPTEDWARFWTGRPGKARRLTLRRGPLPFEEHSPLPPENRWGAVPFALSVPREKLEEAIEHIGSGGVEIHGPVDHEGMKSRSVHLFDPDGNRVELWSPEPVRTGQIHNANPFLQPKRWV